MPSKKQSTNRSARRDTSGILGRSQIINRLRDRRLVVSPIIAKEQLGAASIDLRLGTVMLVVRGRGSPYVDPSYYKELAYKASLHEVEIDRRQKHERYEIPFGTRFLLHPGNVALVPTLEWVRLPRDLHGSVTARSTWAREGLSIATASFVEPGYQGIITLELSNLGQVPLALYPGLRIAQIAFHSVDGDTTRPDTPQFQLSFEPRQGAIAKEDDFPFLPLKFDGTPAPSPQVTPAGAPTRRSRARARSHA